MKSDFLMQLFSSKLGNGLSVIVCPVKNRAKVASQLWLNVGSRDEKTGQQGIAHFLEHVVFKGTNRLSETDIIHITQKLSGYCNAMTSYDYTAYTFDFPRHHWQMGPDLLADMLHNCTFGQDFLNSEIAAVIQELKMYKDDYQSSLEEELVSAIFAGHPYHQPVIGYRQDLWNLSREQVIQFYTHYYVPNNAALVVVGDVSGDEVVKAANNYFGAFKPGQGLEKSIGSFSWNIGFKTVTLFRDVEQPLIIFAFVLPGAKEKQAYYIDVLTWILGQGRGSRLYRRLVDEFELATDVGCHNYDMFESGVLFLEIEPHDNADHNTIIKEVFAQLEDLVQNGITDQELERAMKQTRREQLWMNEDPTEFAEEIGRMYLSTGDLGYINNYLVHEPEETKNRVHALIAHYCRPAVAHRGFLLPLDKKDNKYWNRIQKENDVYDEMERAKKLRETNLEPLKYYNDVVVSSAEQVEFPQYQLLDLGNGARVTFYHRDAIPLITLILDFKADSFYDPLDKQGLFNFMCMMLLEGTKEFPTAQELTNAFENNGIVIDVKPGRIMVHLLKEELPRALELVRQLVTESLFDNAAIKKVRQQIISEIKMFWDEPSDYVKQIAKDVVYKDHPYSKQVLGSLETVKNITRQDLLDAYKNFVSPNGATIALVGDLAGYDIQGLMQQSLGAWCSVPVAAYTFNPLSPISAQTITREANRDQTVLSFAGLGVARMDPSYDALVLFDHIFSGGSSGSMSSRLFAVREETGLFYSIGGSLVAGSDEQPGMIYVTTIVSSDMVEKAQERIAYEIDHAIDTLSPDELEAAKRTLTHEMVQRTASNEAIAVSFLFLIRFGLPQTYFDKRQEAFASITMDQVKAVVKKLVSTKNLAVIKIGRV